MGIFLIFPPFFPFCIGECAWLREKNWWFCIGSVAFTNSARKVFRPGLGLLWFIFWWVSIAILDNRGVLAVFTPP